MKKIISFTFIIFVLQVFAQTPSPMLSEVASGFNNPVDITNAGDSRLFIVEQNGKVKILNEDLTVNSTPFINLGNLTNGGGEQGLLGLAFHPNYAENGYFFVNYTTTQGDSRIARYTVSETDPDVADINSGLILIGQIQPFSNHNAGDLNFGPDGYLYIPFGDGGSGGDPGNRAQNKQTMLGKMLRIDVDNGSPYAIPSDNPFIDDEDALDELWAIGLRNTWRFSFDALTGDMWMADVGQNEWEEIDLELAGSAGGLNYGWRCKEGLSSFNASQCGSDLVLTDPIVVYDHSAGACSVTGGYVYRGSDFPLFYGKYFFTDYCNGQFRYLAQDDADEWVTTPFLGPQGFGWSTFGEGNDGELYVGNLDGNIYQIVEDCSNIEVEITVDGTTLTATEGTSYVWTLDGEVIAGADQQSFTIVESGEYTVIVDNGFGCVVTSSPVVITNIESVDGVVIGVSPNPTNDILRFSTKENLNFTNINIYNDEGKLVWKSRTDFSNEISVSKLKNGVYTLELLGKNERATSRFVVKH